MSIALALCLGMSILAAVIGAAALLRLHTPFEMLHAGSFVSALGGTAICIASFVSDGLTDRSLKVVAIVIVLLVGGALANHTTARALHFRSGERR